MSGVATLPQNWKAREVQAALEFNLTEWQRFLYHTAEEGNRLKSESEVLQWRDVQGRPKLTLIDNVKTRLEEEGISTQDQLLEHAINWGMRQFFKAKKGKPNSPRKPSSSKLQSGEQSRIGLQSPSLLENETSETEVASDEEETKPEDKQEDRDGLLPKEVGKELIPEEQISIS